MQPLQIVYFNPNELGLCRQVPFQRLIDYMTEKQQMYVPSNRISLDVCPQGPVEPVEPVDWLPSVFPAVGRAKRGSQLLAVWQL